MICVNVCALIFVNQCVLLCASTIFPSPCKSLQLVQHDNITAGWALALELKEVCVRVCVCAHVHTHKFQPVKPSLLKLAITSRDKLLISLLLGLLGRKQISPLRIFEDQRQTDEALICHVLSSVPFNLFVSSPQLSLSFSLSPLSPVSISGFILSFINKQREAVSAPRTLCYLKLNL